MAKNLVKTAGLLLVINIAVKLLGFIREIVIAKGFGASSYTDAYLAAYTIPYLLQAILGYAFVSAVLPLLSECWQESGDNSRTFRLGSSLINITAAGMLLLSIIGIAASPALVWLVAPGLPRETAALAAGLARIIFPSMIFMSAGMVISGVLNSRYRFGAAAIAPGLTSLAIILAVAWIAPGNIYALAWATFIGFIAFFLVQLIDLPATGFRYRLVFSLGDPAIRRVFADLLPIVAGLSVNQIYTVVNRIFASSLAEGSISALNYAAKLMNLPLGIFVAAVTTAVFPALAELAQKRDSARLRGTVQRGLSLVLLFAVPAAAGLMLLDYEIVRLLFERGSFSAADTGITAAALMPMAPGLIFLAMSMLLMRVCYALRDVRSPLITGGLSIIVNIGVSFLLVGPMGHAGLSLANSIAAAVHALLLFLILQRRLDLLRDRYVRRSLWQIILATLIMSLPVALIGRLWPHVSTKSGLALELLLLIGVAVAVYLLALKLLHCQALGEILSELSRKERRNRDD
ncbi:MAG: murein biosynthesis integral membrane protein MurJ [Clostridia bacterium]|nr:murein biosynthesis integral membrane protein MurJ [Clostridia bacterium]